MTTIRVYHEISIDGSSRIAVHGDKSQPVKEWTLTDGTLIDPGELVLAPGLYAVIWEYSASRPRFDLISACILEGAGFLECWYKVDKPTGASDPTPLGTHVRWRQKSVSCTAPELFSSQSCRVHPTLTTEAGDTGGLPSAMADGSTVDGLIYKILLRNPATSSENVRFESISLR